MKTKKNKAKGLINWKSVDLDDIKVGDFVKVITMTNSQKYGDDYNKTRIGFLIKKEKKLCDCKIKTRLGKIKKLCVSIGSSGMTILYKATARYREIMRRETGKKITKYDINYSDDDADSVILDNYGSSSSEDNVSYSRSRSRSRSRGKSKKKKKTKKRKTTRGRR